MKPSRIKYLIFPVSVLVFVLVLVGITPNPDQNVSANSIPLQPDTQDTNDFIVVRATYSSDDSLYRLLAWKEPWEVNRRAKYVVLDIQESEIPHLESLGFDVEIDQRLTDLYNQPLTRLPDQTSGIPGFPCYRTVEETYADATQIAVDYPDLAEWIDIGDSWEKSALGEGLGHDLMILVLTNKNITGDKPKLFIMSSVHARELAPAELSTRFAEYLVGNYNQDADVTWLLDYHEIHLLLQTNPDGRIQAESGDLWRKNTNQDYCGATSNDRGADLNRNFSFSWDACENETCSSSTECNDLYRGPSPASEPETQAIESYVRSIFPDQRGDDLIDPAPEGATGVFMDIHSYGQLVLWPWGYTDIVAPNGTALQTLGRKFAYYNDYAPQQAIDLYPTDGTTDDFAYGDLGLAAYTFEIGTTFFESCAMFENTILPENLPAFLYAAKVSRAPYQLPAGPDALAVSTSATILSPGDPLTLTATIDDTRFQQDYGAEPVQNISAAEYYLDVPPWDNAASPVAFAMSAIDGSFDNHTENVQAVIDTQTLSNGRHILYVRGRDQIGNWGPVSANFLYIIDPDTAPVLQGTVVEAGSNLPLQASVTANQSFSAQTELSTGEYQMYVISDTYSIVADAVGHAPQTIDGINLINNQTHTANLALEPYCNVFSDDVESGNLGWTVEGNWAITSNNFHSPTHAWTDSPSGTYENNQTVSLVSPPMDLSEYTNIQIDFWQICDTEPGWDYCYVEISNDDGITWETLAYFYGQTEWRNTILDAPQLDTKSTARIRFQLESDVFTRDDGWYLDDITIRGASTACLQEIFPEASFTSTSPDILGETTNFTNTSTGTHLNHLWDFGDGSPTSIDENPTYTFSSGGEFTVTLTVTNTLGMDVYTDTVEIWDDILYFPVIWK